MGHFALMDPDPDSESGSGTTDLIESRSGSETLGTIKQQKINFSDPTTPRLTVHNGGRWLQYPEIQRLVGGLKKPCGGAGWMGGIKKAYRSRSRS